MINRYCRKCGIILKLENTYPSNFKNQDNICKKCQSKKNILYMKEYNKRNREKLLKQMREYHKKHREEFLAYSKQYNKNLRLEVLIHYGGNPPICNCCKESNIEFLCIDHIYGGGNKHFKQLKKEGLSLYLWLKKNNFPGGFRVLCYNCNNSIGRYGYCPHNKNKIKDKYGEYK